MRAIPIMFFKGEAEGAIPNGERIRKCLMEKGDSHEIGALGRVVASHGPLDEPGLPSPYAYFVEWDDAPGIPVLCGGQKIERA